MYECEWCNDKGGIETINSTGFVRIAECSSCGCISTQEYIDEINKKLEERNQGVGFERTKGYYGSREFAFQEMWAKLNRRQTFNGGYTYLQLLMSPELSKSVGLLHSVNIPPEQIVNERDYKVAATVIQWLGTNIGYSYLKDVIQKIEKEENGRK